MILVTGGTGLLGSHLLMELAKKQVPIRAIKRKTSDLSVVQKTFSAAPQLFDNIEWMDCDILDTETLNIAFENAEYVYHCAAMISFRPNDADLMMKVNAEGAANIVNACLQWKIKKLCHVSSVAALGRNFDGENISEETIWRKSKENNNYALSKYSAEREVWRGIAEGLNAVIVNPTLILGPGDWRNDSSRIFKYVYDRNKFYSDGINGLVDVRDVVKGMIELMSSNINAERFVISSENISFKILFEWIAEALDKPVPGYMATPLISNIFWRIEKLRSSITGSNPLVTQETARTSLKKYFYSNKKIKQAIEINFIPVKESVKWVCEKLIAERKK